MKCPIDRHFCISALSRYGTSSLGAMRQLCRRVAPKNDRGLTDPARRVSGTSALRYTDRRSARNYVVPMWRHGRSRANAVSMGAFMMTSGRTAMLKLKPQSPLRSRKKLIPRGATREGLVRVD